MVYNHIKFQVFFLHNIFLSLFFLDNVYFYSKNYMIVQSGSNIQSRSIRDGSWFTRSSKHILFLSCFSIQVAYLFVLRLITIKYPFHPKNVPSHRKIVIDRRHEPPFMILRRLIGKLFDHYFRVWFYFNGNSTILLG